MPYLTLTQSQDTSRPGQNDENTENRKSKGSPIQITLFQKRDRDKIERSIKKK